MCRLSGRSTLLLGAFAASSIDHIVPCGTAVQKPCVNRRWKARPSYMQNISAALIFDRLDFNGLNRNAEGWTETMIGPQADQAEGHRRLLAVDAECSRTTRYGRSARSP